MKKGIEALIRLILARCECKCLAFTAGYFNDCTAIIGLELALSNRDRFYTTIGASCYMPEKIDVGALLYLSETRRYHQQINIAPLICFSLYLRAKQYPASDWQSSLAQIAKIFSDDYGNRFINH